MENTTWAKIAGIDSNGSINPLRHRDMKKARAGRAFSQDVRLGQPPWNFTTSGTISSATILMILISGLTAGPAVSL